MVVVLAHRLLAEAEGTEVIPWVSVPPEPTAAVEQVVTALRQLPWRERLVLSLRYEQSLLWREVAAVLELSPRHVLRLHQRALRRLVPVLAAAARVLRQQATDEVGVPAWAGPGAGAGPAVRSRVVLAEA